MTNPTWTLVTVTYNSARAIAHCWDGEIPSDVEWIVADNASSDDSADLCESLGATVLRLPENIGFAAANNAAMKQARGTYIGFANPDVHVAFGQLALMGEELERRDGLVAPQLLNPDGSEQPNGRSFPTLTNKFRGRLGKNPERFYRYAAPGSILDVVWITGAFVAMKHELYRSGLQWDERYFVYYEDVDLSIRCWKLGLPVRVMGDVRMVHEWARDTSGGFNLAAWKRELSGMKKFYGRFPGLFSDLTAKNVLPHDFKE